MHSKGPQRQRVWVGVNSSLSPPALAYFLDALLKEDGLWVGVSSDMILLFWWAQSGLWIPIWLPLGYRIL